MVPFVERMTIFPMKSCDGLVEDFANVMPSGALEHDRQFALVDSEGRFINATRTPKIHQLRLLVDPRQREYRVARRDGEMEAFGHLDRNGEELSDWLSNFFSISVSIIEDCETGFPDDLDAPGPTVISTATLQTVAGWFDGLNIEEVRRRFRANIEVGGVEPFWEDQLFSSDNTPKPFRIGQVLFGGTNPCQRCVVPTRDSMTGDVNPTEFSKHFGQRREDTLPVWSSRERFSHFYRLSTNTKRLDQGTGVIRVGDAIQI